MTDIFVACFSEQSRQIRARGTDSEFNYWKQIFETSSNVAFIFT